MDKLTHELHQHLQGYAHLTFVIVIAAEAVCNLLAWETASKVTSVTWIALCLVAATWHFVGWIEHRDAARQDPEDLEP